MNSLSYEKMFKMNTHEFSHVRVTRSPDNQFYIMGVCCGACRPPIVMDRYEYLMLSRQVKNLRDNHWHRLLAESHMPGYLQCVQEPVWESYLYTQKYSGRRYVLQVWQLRDGGVICAMTNKNPLECSNSKEIFAFFIEPTRDYFGLLM